MYNTKFVCTYNTSEVFINSDDITHKEIEFIRDAIYRQELMNILGMNHYNETIMVEKIHKLYEKIKENKDLKECMVCLARHFMSIDEEFGLMILFSYTYMYLTHICVCELLETGEITKKNIDKLKSIVL
jgi:hypothetical protein